MPVAGWRPDVVFQVAFNADPNDPAAVPTWVDLSTDLVSATEMTRGRQYELDITQPAQPTITLRDINEYLNPANTASPYYPDVLPYRQALWQAVWPNPCAGNLINTGAWVANDVLPYDPTFEIYAVGSTPWWTGGFFTALFEVVSSSPHAGTRCLFATLTPGTSFQGIELQVPCIPGRQYTASAWIEQSGGPNTINIGISALATGTNTVTVGSYVRLTVTFTATQPSHLILVFTSGTVVAGNLRVDDVQLEQAASASTFTTTGSVIYPVATPLIERWPRTWDEDSAGYQGFADVIAVDQLAALSKIDIATDFINALQLQYTPDYWWPMSEPVNAVTFAEVNNGPSLVPVAGTGTSDGATFTPAENIGIVGNPGGTGVEIAGNSDTNQGYSLLAKGLTLTTTGSTWALTLAIWASFTDDADTFGLIALANKNGNMAGILREGPGVGGNAFFGGTVYTPFGGFTNTSFGGTYRDGLPHYFVSTFSLAGGTFVNNLYVDGSLVGTSSDSANTAFGTTAPAFRLSTLQVSSGLSGYDIGDGVNGTYAHACIWKRALSSAEILDLWHAGGLGYAGQTSGGCVNQHIFTYGRYDGAARISSGTTIMGAPTYSNSIDLLTDSQNTAVAEGGNVWAAPDGAIVFEGRVQRWYRLTSLYTFGENTANGEYPYEGDIEFDYDPTFVYANVQVTRSNSVPMIGGTAADITAANKRFYNAAYTQTSDFLDDDEAQDQANWIFYTHDNPIQRVNTITLDPASNGNLWPVVLSIELGQRVTVKRRASAANNGAGLVMQADFFVENISHININLDAGTWQTQLQLSPIGSLNNSPPVTMQPGILDNATLGMLDGTMVIAW
jgi:concanavalin A-like lectin/glucanase superfamily protein